MPGSQAGSDAKQHYVHYYLILVALFLLGGSLVWRRMRVRRAGQNPVIRGPKTGTQPRLDSGYIQTESGL
ncbi:hypothetical protein BCR44DRAFT_279237 [Catenaria anguillulae PL171]|uniref:Uncharacterized protein n=1 Tax=Catenaria anguillulae PL171 TaxID=765915 RepID=A0A1Y2HS65_9FUNG|nr:hypothetical protein BCR44DRAFT_279237 [Catenaria anguillulae PL171]